ncbi:MAG: glycosyltransferase family 4 protein [Rickettsiaceae bacterium]
MQFNSKSQSKKNTIAQVIPSLNIGGAEICVTEIASALKRSGYESYVVSSGGVLTKDLTINDVHHLKLNVLSKNPFVMWSNINSMANIIKQNNIDLIDVGSRAPAWSCYFAAKKTNIPIVTTFHGAYSSSSFIKKYYNAIMTKGDRVIAVSNFIKRHILKHYRNIKESKIEVIYRGVDCHYFDQDNVGSDVKSQFNRKYLIFNDTAVILMPARFTSIKGHAILIEALNKIKSLDFQCIIVGNKNKKPKFTNKIQSIIDGLGMRNKVRIFNSENNMRALYSISDIIVIPSILPESFGLVAVEAQAMKKLVISTNIGGALETIRNDHNGFHVKPGSSEDLAEKISYCISIMHSKICQRIQDNARKSVVDNFSLELTLKKTLSLYKSMI